MRFLMARAIAWAAVVWVIPIVIVLDFLERAFVEHGPLMGGRRTW